MFSYECTQNVAGSLFSFFFFPSCGNKTAQSLFTQFIHFHLFHSQLFIFHSAKFALCVYSREESLFFSFLFIFVHASIFFALCTVLRLNGALLRD